ncbi:nudC domain-containing protein 3-like [Pollicipes pollicipes]|uniref:nudC domain-containing protein 3-like n=1 Tax=Pollicipes pollicipes TaxID=41117 RepID=UPI001885075E|nr:nudC domain-containing protein 3-like [Pollicipes pollicipes]
MGSDCYDEALIHILQSEGKIIPFLDVIFGFLHRCTDFYHEHDRPSAVGFPTGVAEQLVVTTFRKWQTIHRRSAGPVPPAVAEEEVVTSSPRDPPVRKTESGPPATAAAAAPATAVTTRASEQVAARPTRTPDSASDCHNGAVRDGYSWSQTIGDVTVRVPVPPATRRARQVSVDLAADRVAVRLAEGDVLLDGRLHRPIQAPESTWSLLPGDSVQLSLEKTRECWWAALLETEPHIDLRQIEAVKPWEDLSEEEQMKIDELRAREAAKRDAAGGQAAVTAGGKDVSALLREAWHAEGSPFQGRPYDPDSVQVLPGGQTGT